MGFLDKFRRKDKNNIKQSKKQSIQNGPQELPKMTISEEKVKEILDKETESFFPKSGVWYNYCFQKPKEVEPGYLPCHLREETWMSKLMHNQLNEKGIYIPVSMIQDYISKSEKFLKLRDNYELEIVKWQINFIMKGGENWLIPEGFNDFSMLFSSDVDEIVRGGVVKTLRAIGILREAIERGLEENADLWRHHCMMRGFENEFEPFIYLYGCPDPADENHKKNWIADKEYKYYQEHKGSVDAFGKPTPAMKMTKEEHEKLSEILKKQNTERELFVNNWKNKTLPNVSKKNSDKTKTDEENSFGK